MQTLNPLSWHIQQNDESIIVQFFGDLTRNTLLPLWQQRVSLLEPIPEQHIYWDLKGLNQLDSAGFTLLIELLNFYQKNNLNCIINPPSAIRNLAELFALKPWITPFLYCEHCGN